MKKLLMILLLSYFPILAEENTDYSQATIRVEKKKIIEASIWISNQTFAGHAFNFQYNLAKSFSVSFNNKLDLRERDDFSVSIVSVEERKKRNKYHLVSLDVKFFPFESYPFFISAGLGRDLNGWRSESITRLGRYSFADSAFTPLFSRTNIDYTPTNLGLVGFGYQWISKTGLSFNIGYLTYYSTNRIRNVYSILDPNNISTNTFVYSYLMDKRNSHYNVPFEEINLGVGYAF